jgi:hypothetical protein
LRKCTGWKILFCGRRSESDCRLDIFSFQAGKAGQNFFGSVPGSKASEHGAQSNPRSLEHRLSSANLGVPDDAFIVALWIATCAVYGIAPYFT